MLGHNENLKDTTKETIRDEHFVSKSLVSPLGDYSVYYTKINKLITALYMVTDTMEKDEPIRLKLRTLGVEILSDTTSFHKDTFSNIDNKISAVLSFLNIAYDLRMVSEMNSNILKKEFIELKKSIQEFIKKDSNLVEDYMASPAVSLELPLGIDRWVSRPKSQNDLTNNFSSNGRGIDVFDKGHDLSRRNPRTRIGVQKGSTLLKALSSVNGVHKNSNIDISKKTRSNDDFELIKNKRRESILEIIRNKTEGINIKDIADALHIKGESIGDKTLQRELASMVKDNVLKKTGEKRWSLYFIF